MTMTSTKTCDVTLAACWCTKDPGHVEAGDPVHECEPHCGGKWIGHAKSADFDIVAFPSGKPGPSGPLPGMEQ